MAEGLKIHTAIWAFFLAIFSFSFNPEKYDFQRSLARTSSGSHGGDSFPASDPSRPFDNGFGSSGTDTSICTPGKGAQQAGSICNRVHTEGASSLTIKTFTPFKVSVTAGFGQVGGNVDLSIRHVTGTEWDFSATGLDPDTNIWDSRGRGVLVPGTLVCRITHRATLGEYKQAGLTLGLMNQKVVEGVTVTAGIGGSWEKFDSNFFEQSQRCLVGTIPAYTSAGDIEKMCVPCFKKISKTLKQDVESRLNALTYLVNTPLCRSDKECTPEDSDWTIGRCVLAKDKNGSHYSECRAKSIIGGTCSGPDSAGYFEYACDAGLKCMKVHEGTGFLNWSGSYDHSRYECRDPKRPTVKKTTRLERERLQDARE